MKLSLPTCLKLLRTALLLLSLGREPGVCAAPAPREMPSRVLTVVPTPKAVPVPKAPAAGIAPARRIGLPAPDLDAVRVEDANSAVKAGAKAPRRIGIKREVEPFGPEKGEWKTSADGTRLWIADVASDGARGLRLHFVDVSLPKGTVVLVYDPQRPGLVEGPFDAEYLAGRDSFWSSTLFSGIARVEVQVAPEAATPSFRIVELTHNYRVPGEDLAKNAGACENDFSCERTDWGETGDAVSGIGSVGAGGAVFCTGCLLNDQNPDAGSNYYLTADHCVGAQTSADTLEFYWFYQTATCNGVEPDPATVPRTRGGADLLSRRIRGTGTDQNDHSFLRIRQALPVGVTFAGWSIETPAAGEEITGIHHPDGDFKRISHGHVDPARSTPNFWNILWIPGRGVTEPGSSGSPIFNSRKQVIGQLYGGASACGNANPADQNDDYGRFEVTYRYVGTWLRNEPPPPPPAGPTNDLFASPTLLAGASGSVAGDTTGALRQAGEPSIQGDSGGALVWFQWTAPSSGDFEFSTLGSDIDTLLGVYTGNALGALGVVAQNDDIATGNTRSRVRFPAVQGTSYRIAVDGYHGESGPIVLNWNPAGATGNNDAFADAVPLSGTSGQVTGDSTGFGREAGEPNHAGNAGGASAWWSWTAPGSGVTVFETTGSRFDTVLGIYTGSAVGGLLPVASNDDFGTGTDSRVSFLAVAGTTYRIAVDGYDGESGAISLSWSGVLAPGNRNDRFVDSENLVGVSGRVTGSNVGFTREGGEPTHQGAGFPPANVGQRSAWWSWTAPTGGTVALDTEGSDFDTVLAVYTGTAVGSLVLVEHNDDAGTGLRTSRVTFTATAGTTYRIAVDGYRRSDGTLAEGSIVLTWNLAGGGGGGGSPDLVVWAPSLQPRLEFRTFAAGDCAVAEGCGVVGRRRLITFDTEVRNQGTADVVLGRPGIGNTNFVWDPCHGHYHWLNYANYRLVGTNGVVATGRKVGFCLLDSLHWSTTNGPARSRYDCNDQGISAGWGDVYGRNLSCQWIDVTEVPDGDYVLEVEVDPANQFAESDETNNVGRAAVHVGPVAVPSNDAFASAREIHGAGGYVHGNNAGAESEAAEPSAGGGATVWFQWTAPCGGNVVLDTEGSAFDTVLAVYSGSQLGSLTRIAMNDDVSPGTWSRLSFAAAAGTTYRIQLDAYDRLDAGRHRLHWVVQGGSCPPVARPLPVERPSADGPFSVGFFGETGETYAMDVSEDLATWVRLLTTTGEGRAMTFTDNGANQQRLRYYRIVQIVP